MLKINCNFWARFSELEHRIARKCKPNVKEVVSRFLPFPYATVHNHLINQLIIVNYMVIEKASQCGSESTLLVDFNTHKSNLIC